jgi:hypothetical protein
MGKPEIDKVGFTNWLKNKLLGKDKDMAPVDTRFLEDLKGIKNIGRYEVVDRLGQG